MSSIEHYLSFAAEKLGIKNPLFTTSYVIKPKQSWVSGEFSSRIPLITFYGEPDLNTIFHEAVHFKQYEDGLDFKNKSAEYSGICYDAYRRTKKTWEEIEWLAYYTAPWEVEARQKAEWLENEYRTMLRNRPEMKVNSS